MIRGYKKSTERGAAALEFALVIPLFLATFGLSGTVGLAMWKRYGMINYAMTTVRVCVNREPTDSTHMADCVSAMHHVLLEPVPNWCPLDPPVPSVNTPVSANPHMWQLTVTVGCHMPWFSWANVGAVIGATGGPTGSLALSASASMPFVQYP